MLVSPFSAIDSWEGYEYQGHTAIFVVLQTIKDFIDTNINEIENYILEIEGGEDFSIIKNNSYLTLHQVKSGNINLNQRDKFCFIISLLQYNAKGGYYHTKPDKTLPTDFIRSTVDWIDTLLIDLEKEIKSESEVPDADDYQKYIMINKITRNTEKGSLYKIIHCVCQGNKKKEQIQDSVKDIKEKLIAYKEKLQDDNDLSEDISLLSKYGQNFSNSQEIKEASYFLIDEILKTLKPEWNLFIDNDYLDFVYGQVILELKNNITRDFINKTNIEEGCRINFSSIFSILMYDYHLNANSVKYQYYLIWKSIQNIFRGYPLKNTNTCKASKCEECDDISNCNLNKQITMMSKIEEEDLHSFLYRLILAEPEIGKANNLPHDNLINRLFISLLKEIDILCYEDNNIIQAQKDGSFYRLTLDSSGEKQELQEQIYREILRSAGDKLLIYESDILITDQLSEENFIYNDINTTVVGEKELEDLRSIKSDPIDELKKNCNKPKVMRLINRSDAKKELN